MEPQISSASPETSVAASPETGTASGGNGTIQPGGEASGQVATATESFIPQGVDLNNLPPQVRAYVDEVNKQMVRGFTEKTTKLSETVKSETQKATESFKQYKEFYDKFLEHDELVNFYNDYAKRTSQPNQAQNDPNNQLQNEVRSIKTKLQEAEAHQVIEAFQNTVDEKGVKINADFDKLDSIIVGAVNLPDGTKNTFSLLRAAVDLAPGSNSQEKLANGYKAAKAAYDAAYQEGKKDGMGRLQNKARNGTFAPSSVNAGSLAPHRAKNATEALEFARRGLQPSRE